MKHRWGNWPWARMAATGLALTVWGAQAQAPDAALRDWRQANEAVGQFPRGHADVLRWEQTQPAPSASSEAPVAFALATPAQAVKAAWKMHRDLVTPMARLGQDPVERIAAGSWGELDPSWQRRVHGVDELLEVAADTRKAWLVAVAARQTLRSLEDAVTAAEAAAELGRRMVSVGTWSRYQQAQVALAESSARMELKRARLAANQAEQALLKTMLLDTVHDRVALPDRLPDLSGAAMTRAEWQRRVAGIQGQLPAAEARRVAVNARQAFEVYLAAQDAYRDYREDVLKQRELIGEETLLRYNGMLESVWGLLADVGVRSQAVVATIAAQRDALLAETDLQWVLQGGQPTALVSLGGGAQATSAAAAH